MPAGALHFPHSLSPSLDLSLPVPVLLLSPVPCFQRMSDRRDLWVKDGGLRLDLRYVASLYFYLCDQSPLPLTSEASCFTHSLSLWVTVCMSHYLKNNCNLLQLLQLFNVLHQLLSSQVIKQVVNKSTASPEYLRYFPKMLITIRTFSESYYLLSQ